MTYTPNRQPEGIPTGGQFAARHRSEGSVLLSDARHAAAAIGSLVRSTAASVKERALQRRPARTRPYTQRARLAVAALVLAASAASLTACGTQENDCKPAASGISAVQATAVTASFLTSVPAKGGGGHGFGHAVHESAGRSTSGRPFGGFHWWPWASHSDSNQQCPAPAPTTKS